MPNTPNLSMLTFFTQVMSDAGKEKILFISLKPVSDIFLSDKIFWYPGKGAGGKAQWIWESLNVKQWVACGTDEMMQLLFDEIIGQNKITIGAATINLELMPHELIPHEHRPFKSSLETVSDHLKFTLSTGIPHAFLQKENLLYLSGYKTGSDQIKPLFPSGFFEQDFIYQKLKAQVWGVKTYRRPYLTYRGVTKKSVEKIGSSQMIGFYQRQPNSNDTIMVAVRNERKEIIGQSPVHGVFKVNLSEPVMKGAVEIRMNGVPQQENEFVLLQGIQINPHIASGTFKDNYGRSFMLGGESKVRPNELESLTWQRQVYADTKEADQKLSDLFREVFNFLGPDILIADPYFIGNFNMDESSSGVRFHHCQAAMINALLHSAIETGIASFQVMGYWARASSQADNDEETTQSKIERYFNKYNQYFQSFLQVNDVEKYLPRGSIHFYNARQEFHNRYWFGLKKTGEEVSLEKVVIMTNSLGNINELDIIPVINETQRLQISRKYNEIFTKAEKKLIV